MFKNFSLGQYVPGNSIVHKLDSRMKFIVLFMFMINLFIIKDVKWFFIIGLFLLDIILLTRINILFFIKSLKAILFFILMVVFFNIFFIKEGTVAFTFMGIELTDVAIEQTSIVLLRLILLVLASSVLTLTTSPVDITYSLEKLLKPLKIIGFPVHEFALMVTISLRFIPILGREMEKIIKAQIARGIDFRKGNLKQRLEKLSAILLPLFFNSFKRADELAIAMEIRCYTGGEGRTTLREYKIKIIDFFAFLVFLFFLIISIYLRFFK